MIRRIPKRKIKYEKNEAITNTIIKKNYKKKDKKNAINHKYELLRQIYEKKN